MDFATGVVLSLVLSSIAVVVAAIGVWVGILGIRQMAQVGGRLEKDIIGLAEVTMDAIKLDGAETRRAIVEVHKSIKEELGPGKEA